MFNVIIQVRMQFTQHTHIHIYFDIYSIGIRENYEYTLSIFSYIDYEW